MFAHKKIIMVTPEHLGDILMCVPAIHYLKSCYPSADIDIIALFGHTQLQRTGPYPEAELPKLTIFQAKKMSGIQSENVLQAIIHLIN